jgi:signal transduction histidine kinase
MGNPAALRDRASSDWSRVAVSLQRPERAVRTLAAARSFRVAVCLVAFATAPLTVVAPLGSGGVDALSTTTVLSVLVAWSFVVSGFIAWDRRPGNRIGALLVALGIAWTIGRLLGPPTTSSSLASTVGIVWRLTWTFGFVFLLVSFADGRVTRRVDRLLAGAVFVVTTPLQILWLLFEERPFGGAVLGEGQVPGVPANAFLLWPDHDVAELIDTAQRAIFIGVTLALVAVFAVRWAGASPPLRRILTPVLAGGVAILVFAVVVAVDKVRTVPEPLWWSLLLAYAALPLALLASMLHARLARSAVADLLIELRASSVPASLRYALARALRDPSVSVAYWVPTRGSYVDTDGRSVELPLSDPARATTLVEREGKPIAAVVHDPALREDPELVDSVCAAAALALDNERLQAELRARLEELRASRARIVEATDAERRRIERNLHDGTQQRLVSIAMELGLAESRLSSDESEARPIIAGARRDLLEALDDLRELSRGIHPGVLTERGLKRALKELAYRTPIPLDLDVKVEKRLPEQVEIAAYFVVCEALANVVKHAGATAASVRVDRSGDRAVVEVADDGIGCADANGSGVRGLADRVEALGGSLSLVSPAGAGTVVRVEIPCV